MGLVSRLPRPKGMSPHELEKMIFSVMGGGITDSGVSVNSDTAMRLITVQNCVRMRASTLQRVPCHVMRTAGRMREKASDFYLYELLLHQPNSWMTAPDFWGMAEAYVSLRGNFCAYKARIGDGPIKSLIPIPASMLRSIKQNEDYSLDYELQFPNGDIRHLN
ncbi:MAG TPA: phage portal protein, partial [Deltaproteobacteria bacterium]|nr:phage portal protein [Deltaproteobacteria bacterium]